jgi:hypothetical protein
MFNLSDKSLHYRLKFYCHDFQQLNKSSELVYISYFKSSITGKACKGSRFLYFMRKNKRMENSADLPCRRYFHLTIYLHVK